MNEEIKAFAKKYLAGGYGNHQMVFDLIQALEATEQQNSALQAEITTYEKAANTVTTHYVAENKELKEQNSVLAQEIERLKDREKQNEWLTEAIRKFTLDTLTALNSEEVKE